MKESCKALKYWVGLCIGVEYYPFGETSFGSYGKKRYRFCGKEKDEESGLYYYGMRYYSAWTCRFVNVDPLAAKYPFYSPYQYAGNKSINFSDLDGAEPTINSSTHSNNQESAPQQPSQSNGDSSNGGGGKADGQSLPSTPNVDFSNKTTKNTYTSGTYKDVKDTSYGTYKVGAGDTVSAIAKKYGDSNKSLKENIDLIKNVNGLDADAKIKVGETLTIRNESKSVGGDYSHSEHPSSYLPMTPAQSMKLEEAKPTLTDDHNKTIWEGADIGPVKLGGNKAGYEAGVKSPAGGVSGKMEFTERGQDDIKLTKTEGKITPPSKETEVHFSTYFELKLKGDWRGTPSLKTKFPGYESSIDSTGTFKLKLGINFKVK